MSLGVATDRLNEALLDAEDALAGLKLGVAASVPVDETHVLSFEKDGAEWVLIVTGTSGRVPVVKASRRLRVLAAHLLDDLRLALVNEHDKEVERVEHAIVAAVEFAARLREVQP